MKSFLQGAPQRIRLLAPEGPENLFSVPALACAGGGGGGGQQPDLYKEYVGELTAKAQMAPSVFATEASYEPAYAGLNLNLLNDTLFGVDRWIDTPTTIGAPSKNSIGSYINPLSSGASITGYLQPTADGSYTVAKSNTSNFDARDNGSRHGAPADYGKITVNYQPTQRQHLVAPGLLDIYSRAATPLAEAQAKSTTATRTANVRDLANLGPAALAAQDYADPRTASLLSGLTDNAQRGLDMGAMMDPSLNRLATQGVLASRTGTLGGTGNAGDFNTALGLSSFGQQLRTNRQQFAGDVFGKRAGYYGNTLNNIMQGGNFVNPLSGANSALGIGQGGPRLFGSDINAQQTYSDALNASNAASIAKANNSAATTSAGISAGVSALGSLALLALL